jgi:hypothetical protein
VADEPLAWARALVDFKGPTGLEASLPFLVINSMIRIGGMPETLGIHFRRSDTFVGIVIHYDFSFPQLRLDNFIVSTFDRFSLGWCLFALSSGKIPCMNGVGTVYLG